MRQRQARFCVAAATILVGLGGAASDARAQAWVGDPGSLDVSFDYNFGRSTVVTGDDIEFDPPPSGTDTHQLTLGVEYAPIRKLAITASLPLVFLKYTGDPIYAHPGGGSYDDGDFHTTLTDARAGIRYAVLEDTIALAPHIAGTVPVADYETVGNTVGGRHLAALHVGVGVGTVIGDATYLHLSYEYSFVQAYDRDEVRTNELQKHEQDRSDMAFTIGHKLLDYRLDVHLDASARFGHGGVSLDDLATLSGPESLYHDAILKETIVLAGAGVGYQINNQFGVSLAAQVFLTGANTQKANVLALGLTWSPLTE